MGARKSDRAAKRLAVLEAATRLFLERGVHRATMTELAESLNLTKPALYNYFRSKDEILVACVHLANEYTSAALAEVEALEGTGFERMRAFVERYVGVCILEYGACMNRIDDRDLPDPVRDEIRRIDRVIDQRVRALIERGVEDESIVKCDVRLTTFAIMGSMQWISRWYRPDGSLGAEEIAAEFTKRLMASLSPGNGLPA